MRKYYCDICGKEMLKPDADAIRSCEAAMAVAAEDVCVRCLDIGRRINVREMVRKHWQALTGVSAAAAGGSETAAVTTPKRETGRSAQNAPGRKPGQHWAEKRRIAGELRAYRDKHGLGSLQALAKQSGVDADVLRQMLSAKPYPIDVWQRVDKGLQKLREDAEQE